MPLLFAPIFSPASPPTSSPSKISAGFLLLRRATTRLLNTNLPPFSPISNLPSPKNPTALLAAILASSHRCWPLTQLLKLGMSESCLPSSPPLMLPSASSS
ncbi:hypothetical protein TIFTF001_029181 [Ficus carica]|uniref:Uncharacterized protein n=1 Tax=Ficus carica TaxID=3494 RepID=A0AA88DRG4_FICCA|nr:hypothetical protein TIFTF001_029181 [Ficus carica]